MVEGVTDLQIRSPSPRLPVLIYKLGGTCVHSQQLASSYFGPAEAERLRLAGDSGTERFSSTVRQGDSVASVLRAGLCVSSCWGCSTVHPMLAPVGHRHRRVPLTFTFLGNVQAGIFNCCRHRQCQCRMLIAVTVFGRCTET